LAKKKSNYRVKKNQPAVVVQSAPNNDRTWLMVIGCIGLVLALFSGKAFHIDDPLFIWVAQQIQVHPLNFYGFSVNWYGAMQPMSEITKNPPLAAYFAALVMSVFHNSGVALHLAFIIPALAAMAGTYRLAKRWSKQPVIAILASAITPVFMVSATTIMCDMFMVCFFVWALEFWIQGLETGKHVPLLMSALCICLSALSKYFGISMLPLLLVYTLMVKQKPGWWIVYLLAACAVLWGYNAVTAKMYGHGLLTDAVSYTQNLDPLLKSSLPVKSITTLIFSGGCLLSAVFFMPFFISRKWLIIGLAAIAAGIGIMYVPGLWAQLAPRYTKSTALELFQGGIFIAGALACIGVVILDVYKRRDAASIVLLLWVLGTLAFTGFFNWTINARSILPMAPALGIVIARRIGDTATAKLHRKLWMAIIPAAALSLLVTWADYAMANSSRDAADSIARDYGSFSRTIYFEGHWGFQYYMEQHGFKAIDFNHTDKLKHGDIIVLPYNNTNVFPTPDGFADKVSVTDLTPCPFLTVMNVIGHAGFYAHGWGPLPYAFGKAPAEIYTVNIIK